MSVRICTFKCLAPLILCELLSKRMTVFTLYQLLYVRGMKTKSQCERGANVSRQRKRVTVK